MTSSLVGSEMCIRDRGISLRRLLGRWQPPPPALYGAKVLLRSLPFYGAVSYTHLTLPTICSV
eukprot:1253833-Prorocentrum_lima.AAC.1